MIPYREILKNERLPAVLVDLDAFDRNAKKVVKIAGSKSVRIATKSIRVPDLIERVLALGTPFRGVMCYSAEEASALAARGIDDFLIAYPTAQSSDLQSLAELHRSGKTIRLVVDSLEQIRALEAHISGATQPFEVLLEVDASLRIFGAHLGVRRSPLRSARDVESLLEASSSVRGIKIVGAMVYEAQVAGLGDRNPFHPVLNRVKHWIRSISVHSVARRRKEIAALFRAHGAGAALFNGGGTGSLNYAAAESALTEVTAGSALLCSHLFDYYSNIGFEPACFFALQVVRASDPGFVTCQGGGYVASGEPGWDKVPRPYAPQGLQLVSAEACGEVQTPLRLPSGVTLSPGDSVLFRHAKAGELAERFNEYLLVSGGRLVSRAKTYRGMGWSFF